MRLLILLVAARTAAAATPTITPLVTPGGVELPATIAATAFCDSSATAALVLHDGQVLTIDRSETLTPVVSLGHPVTGMPGLLCDQAGRIVLAGGGALTTIDGTKVTATPNGPPDVRGSRVLDDGSLVFVDLHGTVWHWDGTSFTSWTFKGPGFLWSVAINRDASAVATTIRGRVTVFTSTGATWYGPQASGVAWSNDSRSLLVVGQGGLHRWTLGTPVTKLDPIDPAATGTRLLVGARYALAPRPSHLEVRELDAAGKLVSSASISRIPFDAFAYVFGTSNFAVVTSTRRAWVVQLAKSHELVDHTHAIETVHSLAFSPTGKTIALVGGDDDVLVAPIDGRRPSRRVAPPHQLVGSILGWLADGTIVAGSVSSFVQLFRNGTSNTSSHTGLVVGLTAAGDMIEATRDHHVTVHGAMPVTITTGAGPMPIPTSSADMAGHFLAVRQQKHVEVWDLTAPAAPVLTSTEQHWISNAALVGTQPSAMFTVDRSLYLIDATGERVVDTMSTFPTVVAASPDRRRIAIGSSAGTVSFYDDAGTKQYEATTPSGMMVTAIAWSPDQTQVAVATPAGVELWLLP